MSAESLRAEVEFVLSNTGKRWEAASALITDFLRVLHELTYKADRDQSSVPSQVQAVFGSTTLHHLARTLNASTAGLQSFALANDAPLHGRLELMCKQRGFEPEDGRHLLAHFIKALDEERTDEDGNIQSAAVMLYWSIGHEAAYHLSGLYVGDDHDVVATELGGYLDTRLKRFYRLVEMWEMERTWEREDAE